MEPALDTPTLIVVCFCLIAYLAITQNNGILASIPLLLGGILLFIGLPLFIFLGILLAIFEAAEKFLF